MTAVMVVEKEGKAGRKKLKRMKKRRKICRGPALHANYSTKHPTPWLGHASDTEPRRHRALLDLSFADGEIKRVYNRNRAAARRSDCYIFHFPSACKSVGPRHFSRFEFVDLIGLYKRLPRKNNSTLSVRRTLKDEVCRKSDVGKR